MKKISIIFTALLLLLSGCSSEKYNYTVLADTKGYLSSLPAENIAAGVVTTINDFNFKLGSLADAKKNIFYSSLSIYLALSMTYHGASQATYDEFTQLLNPSKQNQSAFLKDVRSLQAAIAAYPETKIKLANSIWIRDTFAKDVEADFLTRNKDYFGAMIAALDFTKSTSIDAINKWVDTNTEHRIQKVIDSIDPNAQMFLINTIYFKADWLMEFAKESNRQGVFHSDSDLNVTMMHMSESMPYVENTHYQAIQLDYKDQKTSIILVVGKNSDIPITSNNQFNQLVKGFQTTSVDLTMPKVNITTDESLAETLKKLGLTKAFDPNQADFSALSKTAQDRQLYLMDVLHKTTLTIDEKGTEAAAATTVIVGDTSMPINQATLLIDHPYQVFIIDNESKLILFSGFIKNPLK